MSSAPSSVSGSESPSGERVRTPTAPITTPATSYRSVEMIAKGGMGKVELVARQEGRFRRLYALKRLHEHLLEDGDFQSMFLDEARVAGLIDHPNVVSVLDVGFDAQGPYLVMPYVHGLALSRIVSLSRKVGPMPIQVVLRIGLDVARGLHAAHEVRDGDGLALGLVHRDLSPQNVLVGFDGSARVTDFGIAKVLGQSTKTSTGVAKGKHAYMSPEQLTFRAVDRRSDLFALGIILYEMLAGRRLYGGVGSDGPRQILEDPPPDIGQERADVPPGMVELLFELLAKERESRPVDAAVVAVRLEALLADRIAHEPITQVADYLESIAPRDRAELAERQRRALTMPLQLIAPIATPGAEDPVEAGAASDGASAIAAVRAPTSRDRGTVRRIVGALVLALVAGLGLAWGLSGRATVPPAPLTPPQAVASARPIEPPMPSVVTTLAAPLPEAAPPTSAAPPTTVAPSSTHRGAAGARDRRPGARTPPTTQTAAHVDRAGSTRVGWDE